MQAGDTLTITSEIVREVVPPKYEKNVLADEAFDSREGCEQMLLPAGLKIECLGAVPGYKLTGSGIQTVEAHAFRILPMQSGGSRFALVVSQLYAGYVFLMSKERQKAHLGN